MSTPPREPPLTLASALPIALVLHVKNRVAEERRRARRRARLEDQLVQAGKLRDRLVAPRARRRVRRRGGSRARASRSSSRAATGAVAPRETEPEDDPFLFLRRARAFRLAELAAAGARPEKHPDPSPRASPRSPRRVRRRRRRRRPRDRRRSRRVRRARTPPRDDRRDPRRARDEPVVGDDPGPIPGPGPAVATSPLPAGSPSVGERYATLAVHAIAAARDAETTNISEKENLRVIARDATDALVDAFLRADDSGSRIARRARSPPPTPPSPSPRRSSPRARAPFVASSRSSTRDGARRAARVEPKREANGREI